MWIAFILMTAVLQAVCRDQEVCELLPRNPVIPYGSGLTVFLKAPSSSNWRSKMAFSHSKIFWTLNKRKIDERFYGFNSTFASVSIRNVSVENGTVECFLNTTTPVLLHGTFIQTYPLVSSPENVSCIGKLNLDAISPIVTCMWDHDQHTKDITYTAYLKQKEEYSCESSRKECTFSDNVSALFERELNISVSAKNSHGYSARSNEVTYRKVWDIVQMDAPEDVIAEPLPTGFRVKFQLEQKSWSSAEDSECEIRLHEQGSHTEPVVKSLTCGLISTVEMTGLKPCTNFTVFVRSRHNGSVWSTWSREVTTISYLNVSSLKFHLWRSKSVLADEGKRTVHLMWKGVPPSCNAFDEYRLFWKSLSRPKCFGPNQNHMFITLDEHPHRITVAVFRNETNLNEASIEIPAMAEEVNLPAVENISVFVKHGCIHLTWKKPSLPVSGYIIVWNSTDKNHMWQQTLEPSFTLKGEPSIFYTISLTALYKDGPGNETTLHNCSQKKNLTKVSKVQVTEVSDKQAEIHWLPLLPSQCCAFVLSYTVSYKPYNEPTTRNVTVGPNQHHVILDDLQARTAYSVHIMAHTVTASSKSVPVIFSTKLNSKGFLIVIITCCVGLILLPILAVMIRRKFLSKKIPDPRFSSLSMWPSDSCRMPWHLLPVPGGRETEKILPCHVDNEVISVSATSKKDLAVNGIQNIATHETSSQTEKTPLAASFSSKGQLLFVENEQTSGIQSPYREQTPLNSPMESPTKPVWSDETEALLTPKLKNTTYFTSYVTLDMFESGKQATK